MESNARHSMTGVIGLTALAGADQELTLHEVADLLSVHYMTVYRYVRLGQLAAFKRGASWRVQRSAVDVFQSGSGALSSVTTDDGARRDAPWAERLEARLLEGDRRGSWGILQRALAAGSSVQDAYLDIVAPAMRSIGDRWEAGQLEVAVEHRATSICLGLVYRLGEVSTRRGRTKGGVIVGAVPGERHSLPLSILSECLRLEGWNVCDLGADVPVKSFVYAAENQPNLVSVAVSASLTAHLDAAEEVISALVAARPNLPIVVGGLAIRDHEHARSLGAQHFAADARQFVALLAEFGKEPQPPDS
jgi:excisionase family DNA binding protein